MEFARAVAQQLIGPLQPLGFAQVYQKIGLNPELSHAALGRQHDHTRCAGLIAKHRSRSEENEGEDQSDHHVVLPACPGKFPKNELAQRETVQPR